MLPVLGKPMVVRVMERLVHAGILDFDVIVGDDEGGLVAYLDSHWLPNVNIHFHMQSVADTLSHVLSRIPYFKSEPVLLASYNSFTHPHFTNRLIKQSEMYSNGLTLSGATLSLSRSGLQHYASLDDDRVMKIGEQKEQTDFAVTDMAICDTDFGQFIAQSNSVVVPEGARELIALYSAYIQHGGEAHLVETAWALQVETDPDLLVLNSYMLGEEHDAHILSELPGTVQITPPVRIDPQVSVGQHAKIGPYVYLESGCSIGHHAQVSHTVVLQKAVISPNETVSQAIISTRARIDGR
jgi:NDP-sugar pyrophosphorylase family protein